MTDSLFPLISLWTGFAFAGLTSASYVAAVYISLVVAAPRPPLGRDAPEVIRARSVCATLSTLLCCAGVYVTIRTNLKDEKINASQLTSAHLGLSPLEPLRAFLIVPLLFLGPLYATLLEYTQNPSAIRALQRELTEHYWGWLGFRNFVMAPVTEEVTYRACVLSFYNIAGASRSSMVWTAPCWFGLAHIHHGFEVYKTKGRTHDALRAAIGSTVFQFAYTTLFGWLCSFLFMRTGSLSVVVLSHAFCNIMGFPTLFDELRRFPRYKISIIATYFLGLTLFVYTLFPWSFNPRSMYWT